MDTWFTSDTHFGQATLMTHYPKGRDLFSDVFALDEHMIEVWNDRIKPKDRVYHVGDFGSRDYDYSIKCLKRLNGEKILVPGNHDYKLLKRDDFISEWSKVAPYSYLEANVEGQQIIFCHFPIWEWKAIHYGSYHIHGHVHGKPTGIPGRILDVGVDGNGLTPWKWEEVATFMAEKPVRTHHGNLAK